uniref:CSON004923 protein n=1 Tax=Culicoides sonorensis TaxID=179676 RepID=A0A336MVX6_CULSO
MNFGKVTLVVLTYFVVAVTAGALVDNSTLLSEEKSMRKLSRKRRYIVFPVGSSFSVACCLTIGMYGNPSYDWISWAINWGIAYNLPNETYSATLRRKAESEMPRSVTQRRFRRDLYNQIEIAMDNMGYNGRECILRALCETSQLFGKKGSTMVKELLRTAFSLPTTKVLPFEHPDLMSYDEAYRKGKDNIYCAMAYPNCGFSLHGIALGKYSDPPMNFM